MGVVYEARQVSLQRLVALKVISPEISDQPDFRSRFERESRLAASIDHPNVVSVHAAGEIEGLSYIAMQWIDGTNVAEALAHGPLDLKRVVAIGEQIGKALDAVHATGLTHRDIKPANILLRRLGGGYHAYLTDFGIAKRTSIEQGTDLTGVGNVVGTINYMAPEQIKGEAVASSDLYALGCVLFEAATGRRPFERDNEVAVMWAQMQAPRPRPSELRPELDASFDQVIERALAIRPGDRFATGAELAEALRRAGAGVPLPPPGGRPVAPPTLPAAPPPPPPPTDPTAPAPPQRPPPRPTARLTERDERRRGPSRRLLIGGSIVLVLLAAAAVAAALIAGGGSGGGETARAGGATTTTTTTTTSSDDGSQQSVGEARTEIEALLHSYEQAYSNADLGALGALLSEDVTRYGVVGGGCGTRHGKPAVLDAYGEQFAANGPLSYELTGLEPGAIDVSGERASSSLGYVIGGSSTGSIDFRFARVGGRWLISDINASCG